MCVQGRVSCFLSTYPDLGKLGWFDREEHDDVQSSSNSEIVCPLYTPAARSYVRPQVCRCHNPSLLTHLFYLRERRYRRSGTLLCG